MKQFIFDKKSLIGMGFKTIMLLIIFLATALLVGAQNGLVEWSEPFQRQGNYFEFFTAGASNEHYYIQMESDLYVYNAAGVQVKKFENPVEYDAKSLRPLVIRLGENEYILYQGIDKRTKQIICHTSQIKGNDLGSFEELDTYPDSKGKKIFITPNIQFSTPNIEGVSVDNDGNYLSLIRINEGSDGKLDGFTVRQYNKDLKLSFENSVQFDFDFAGVHVVDYKTSSDGTVFVLANCIEKKTSSYYVFQVSGENTRYWNVKKQYDDIDLGQGTIVLDENESVKLMAVYTDKKNVVDKLNKVVDGVLQVTFDENGLYQIRHVIDEAIMKQAYHGHKYPLSTTEISGAFRFDNGKHGIIINDNAVYSSMGEGAQKIYNGKGFLVLTWEKDSLVQTTPVMRNLNIYSSICVLHNYCQTESRGYLLFNNGRRDNYLVAFDSNGKLLGSRHLKSRQDGDSFLAPYYSHFSKEGDVFMIGVRMLSKNIVIGHTKVPF